MKKINENELFDIINKFNNKNIILEYKDIVKVNNIIENADISYNMNNGRLQIKNKVNTIEINIAFANRIVTDENYTILEIYLDNKGKVNIKTK
ncbi:MAG: hypothetical protein IKG14_04595 [Clostridia bacterium]|nr:hypothetical protein [Clostridia bacterium]